MSEPYWEFVAVGPGDAECGPFPAGLQAHYDRSHAEQRTWLDTPDWRLHHAGLTLSLRTADGATALQLEQPASRPVHLTDPAIAWPALLPALPAGDLRAALEPVVQMRALQQIVAVHSTLRRFNVVNADDKTVARIVVDDSTVVGATALPTRLRLSALRGYHGPAQRVAEALRADPHLQPSQDSGYAAALASLGRSAGDDEVAPAAIAPAMAADLAVLEVLRVYRRTVEANLRGVIDDIDTEFLHDLRVAVRRARSTVKLTGDVLPASQSAPLGAELKWLGDLTSPTRDLDVYLLGLPGMASGLRSAAPRDLQPFQAHLRRSRRTEWRRLVRGLQSSRMTELMNAWAGLSTKDVKAKQHASAFAAERIARAHKKVLTKGAAITADSPAEDLHDVRKRCKELRYLLEMFRPLHPKAAHRAALQSLKALQECLGDFQDSEVQAHAVRSFATRMVARAAAPADTVLAMGELAAQLAAQQHLARERFTDTFAHFACKESRRRFAVLSTVDSS